MNTRHSRLSWDSCEEWTGTHVFLTIRDPPLPSERDDQSRQYAQDLKRYSPRVEIHPLAAMDLGDRRETARMCQFLHLRIPAAIDLSDATLCTLIAGYPGVIDFWLHASERSEVQTVLLFAYWKG